MLKENCQDSWGVSTWVGYMRLTTPSPGQFRGQNILIIAEYFDKNYFFFILIINKSFQLEHIILEQIVIRFLQIMGNNLIVTEK